MYVAIASRFLYSLFTPSAVGRLSKFFFSSRRRHTSCLSDWSSDVCSSDLGAASRLGGVRRRIFPRIEPADQRHQSAPRSEERRVGKECRSRWAEYQQKKKKHLVSARQITMRKRQETTRYERHATENSRNRN